MVDDVRVTPNILPPANHEVEVIVKPLSGTSALNTPIYLYSPDNEGTYNRDWQGSATYNNTDGDRRLIIFPDGESDHILAQARNITGGKNPVSTWVTTPTSMSITAPDGGTVYFYFLSNTGTIADPAAGDRRVGIGANPDSQATDSPIVFEQLSGGKNPVWNEYWSIFEDGNHTQDAFTVYFTSVAAVPLVSPTVDLALDELKTNADGHLDDTDAHSTIVPYDFSDLELLLGQDRVTAADMAGEHCVFAWNDVSEHPANATPHTRGLISSAGSAPYATGLRGRAGVRCETALSSYMTQPWNDAFVDPPFEIHMLLRQDAYTEDAELMGETEGNFTLRQGPAEGDIILKYGIDGPTVNVPIGYTVHLIIAVDVAESTLQVDEDAPVVAATSSGLYGLHNGFYVGAGFNTYSDITVAGLFIFSGLRTTEERIELLNYWR